MGPDLDQMRGSHDLGVVSAILLQSQQRSGDSTGRAYPPQLLSVLCSPSLLPLYWQGDAWHYTTEVYSSRTACRLLNFKML